tara:strand:+ start:5467 stop:7191 length:1725 start_codon:yes stop_codon:yes gene_type:complete
MGTPTNRTPVRVARGSTTALNTGLSDIQEGEIVWDTTLNKLQVKEGSALENHTVDTSTLAPLAGADFTGPITVGVDGTGHDVKFFGAGAGKYCLWDENQNRLEIEGGLQVNANDTATFKGQTTIEGQVNFTDTSGNSLIVGDGTGFYQTVGGNNPTQPVLMLDYDTFEAYYQGSIALSTNSSGIQVTSDGTGIPGLQGQLDVGSSSNCRLEAFSDNGNNSAEDNNTFKIYSQHGNNNTTKTGILYQSFFDQVWRVKGEGGSGCSGITNAELGRINHDGGWELRYHDVQGTAPNWTGTTCDKKFETTADGVTITGNLIVNGTTTEINSTTLTVDDKNIELGKGTGSVTTGQTATLVSGTNNVTVASTVGYLPGAALLNLTGTANAFGSATPFVKSITSSTVFTVGDGAGNVLNHVNSGAVGFDVGAASDLTANGGGITLKGSTDKTILWTDSTDSWDFNQDIKTSGTVSDSKGDVRTIPASSSATNVLPADAGKFIPISAGIILDTNTAFTAGQAVTIYNDQGASNDEVITVTGVTLYLATDPAASGNRTLAGRGIATILCTAANTYVISGAGLS